MYVQVSYTIHSIPRICSLKVGNWGISATIGYRSSFWLEASAKLRQRGVCGCIENQWIFPSVLSRAYWQKLTIQRTEPVFCTFEPRSGPMGAPWKEEWLKEQPWEMEYPIFLYQYECLWFTSIIKSDFEASGIATAVKPSCNMKGQESSVSWRRCWISIVSTDTSSQFLCFPMHFPPWLRDIPALQTSGPFFRLAWPKLSLIECFRERGFICNVKKELDGRFAKVSKSHKYNHPHFTSIWNRKA